MKYLLFIMFFYFLPLVTISAQNLSRFDSLEHILNNQKLYDSSTCIVLDTLFEAYKHQDFNRTKLIGEKALKIGDSLNNIAILQYWNRNMGHLYSNYEIYSIALDYYIKGIEYSKQLGIIDNWWYINIGNIYFADKNFTEANISYKNAIKQFSSTNIKDTIDAKTGIAVAYSNMALIYREKLMFDSALVFFGKSLLIRKKLFDNNSNVFTCNLIAETYIEIDSIKLAQEYFNKAFFYDMKTNNHAFLPNIYLLQASLLIKQKKYELALSKLNETSKVSINLENKNTELKSYRLIIKLLKKQKQYTSAIVIAQKAIKLSENLENTIFKAELFKDVAKLYYVSNKLDSAYKYLNLFIEVNDTLEVFKYSKLQTRYETELSKAQLIAVKHKLEKSNQKNIFYKFSFIIGAIILIILTLLLVIVRKAVVSLKVKNERIYLQKNTILTKNEEILQQNEEISSINIQLDKHKNQLEEKIKEQTADLLSAKENAERADNLKTAFLENLSHEIRTPLNAIVGFSNLMELEENLSESNQKFLHYISNSSDLLLRIIDSIMQVSNMQLGDYKHSVSNFNLNNLLLQLSSEFKNTEVFIKKEQFQLKTKFEIEPNTIIKSDHESLKTILYNLIDNAIKFTENGIIELGVSKGEKNRILFYVKDSGIGIASEDIQFIFDKFRKVEPNKSKLYRGLGLGLTIAKSLVKQLGGEIWLESEQGKGSKFYFTIPISN